MASPARRDLPGARVHCAGADATALPGSTPADARWQRPPTLVWKVERTMMNGERAVGTQAALPPRRENAVPVRGPDDPLAAGPPLLVDGAWRTNVERVLAVTRRYFEAPLPAPRHSVLEGRGAPVADERASCLARRDIIAQRDEHASSTRVRTRGSKRSISLRR